LPAGTYRARADAAAIRVGYIRSIVRHPVISLLDQPGPDAGLAGAKLTMDDNNTTGRTLGQTFELIDMPVRKGADLPAALDQLAGQGVRLVVTDLPADGVLTLADGAGAHGMTIMNLVARDDSLREQDCR